MTVTVASFRKNFREFSDPDSSPDDAVTFWIGIATNFLNGSSSAAGQRFDAITLDYAVSLFVAHHLVLSLRNQAAAASGGIPGEVTGPATAKAVDKVSKSIDTKAVTFEGQAFWNQTTYGVQLYNLALMFGAGGIQLGTDADLSSDNMTNPWPTPFGLNFPG